MVFTRGMAISFIVKGENIQYIWVGDMGTYSVLVLQSLVIKTVAELPTMREGSEHIKEMQYDCSMNAPLHFVT